MSFSTQLAIAGTSGSNIATTSSGNPETADDDKCYDKIYFDSDDEEDDSQEMEGSIKFFIFSLSYATNYFATN